MQFLNGVVFVAAQTTRSQAYAQALVDAGLQPEKTIIFGPERSVTDGTTPKKPLNNFNNVFFPDLSIPLGETCEKAGWEVSTIVEQDVNSGWIAATIKELQPTLVIYSGFGGQLVGAELLSSAESILHIHSGWLPEYRGSTTIYYSIIQEGMCGVSAILLDSDIDTGALVARRKYPLPPPGINVDLIFDNALRANLLRDVLLSWCDRGGFEVIDRSVEHAPFYVIHPVLKHIALLSIDPE